MSYFINICIATKGTVAGLCFNTEGGNTTAK